MHIGDLVRYTGETHPEIEHGEVGVVRAKGLMPACGLMALVWRGEKPELWIPANRLHVIEEVQDARADAHRLGVMA